ncbi:upstream activation factor subunit UAF30-like [Macadamia integrifolia]|uniref:upstream activation factor subunit UAF30-like n=1 Tax=Macadamia integrifolia TaxID=60698 RepID=UPI001C4F019F|nr:upstream activation factor subunit UAF30-like [Macadamia integrifolia]
MAMSLSYCWSGFIGAKSSSTLRLAAPPPPPSPATICTVRLVTSAAASSKPASSSTGKRQPRGITKPKPISPAMQELLGVPEIPRTQALKQIWAYIKKHNLQDPENKKIIVCDEKLKNIFGGREHVGFLEISGLITPHFIK